MIYCGMTRHVGIFNFADDNTIGVFGSSVYDVLSQLNKRSRGLDALPGA